MVVIVVFKDMHCTTELGHCVLKICSATPQKKQMSLAQQIGSKICYEWIDAVAEYESFEHEQVDDKWNQYMPRNKVKVLSTTTKQFNNVHVNIVQLKSLRQKTAQSCGYHALYNCMVAHHAIVCQDHDLYMRKWLDRVSFWHFVHDIQQGIM